MMLMFMIFFTVNSSNLRGHSFKLFKPRFQSECGKFTFVNRVVNEWNLLPGDIIACNTVDNFKNKLDHYLRSGRGFT